MIARCLTNTCTLDDLYHITCGDPCIGSKAYEILYSYDLKFVTGNAAG